MIAERFRQAREAGKVADVKQLSATLRKLKQQITATGSKHRSSQTQKEIHHAKSF
jgi:hypothetical protein